MSCLVATRYQSAMLRMMIVAVVFMVSVVMTVRHLENVGTGGTVALSSTPTLAPVSSSVSARNVVLTKAPNGHFQVEARVDGRRIEFLVDTGASHIALREREAARLGIYPRPSDYTVRVSTANGVTKAALVQLRSVEVGDILVRDVSAIVHPDEGLSVNLLGMTFLSRVRWTHERGKLVLEQ